MAPFTFRPDGLYKFVNFEYESQAADLIGANPSGHISGYHLNNDSKNQTWFIRDLIPFGFTFENEAAQGSYAFVRQHVAGAELYGDNIATEWRLIPFDPRRNIYWIATPDTRLAWYLPGGEDYTHIVLARRAGPVDRKALWKLVEA